MRRGYYVFSSFFFYTKKYDIILFVLDLLKLVICRRHSYEYS